MRNHLICLILVGLAALLFLLTGLGWVESDEVSLPLIAAALGFGGLAYHFAHHDHV